MNEFESNLILDPTVQPALVTKYQHELFATVERSYIHCRTHCSNPRSNASLIAITCLSFLATLDLISIADKKLILGWLNCLVYHLTAICLIHTKVLS